jgi:phage FluMu protein Com
MFEDETVDIKCPRCGHLNSILVRELESATESHIVCVGCQAAVRVEAREFHDRLGEVRKELEELEREAEHSVPKARPAKDDYQI